MTVEEWLGKDNKLGIDIWTKKYQRNNENFDEWVERVSGGDKNVATLIKDKKFLFGGRILSNRGIDDSDEKTTYSNCYVITPPKDNLESIYDTCSKLARTYSVGGGCGIDISNLAPAGAKVHNQAKTTSGAVSFMDTFSQVTEQIGQNGRRGALMISIDCHHPDLEKFITAKSDLKKVTSANISVRVTNDFMNAVENDGDWELSYTRTETGERIEKAVKAKDIYHLLCKNNWDYAEPGILFWDNITGYNMLNNNPEFEYAGTNPCLTGDTLISTTLGECQIKDLVGTTPDVYCMDENGNIAIRKATRVWMTRNNAQVVKVNTARGGITCTPDHLIHTRNRGWVSAQDLRRGDKITGLNRQMKGEIHVSVGLSGGIYTPEHRLVAGYYYDINGKDVHHINGDTLNNSIKNLEVLEHSEHSRLSNTGRSIEVIRDELGRYVNKQNKAKRHSFNLGCGVGTNWTVQSVEWLDERQDVYDMTVEDVHNFVANRMVVHNCAEEPLPAGGSCLLGSLNLAEFVKDKKFDYDEFASAVHIAVRALNNVLDEGLMKHPLQEQRDSVRDWRQIGLGIMGLADMLIKLGIEYGSDESISLCDAIGEAMAHNAILASVGLANQFGSYPKYNENLKESAFYTKHIKLKEQTNGMRNSQLLTIAPTGSISTMIGVSGGIEPIFANSYTRMTKSLHGHDEVYKVYTPIVKAYMDKNGIDNEEDLPNFFVTSATIPVENRIKMQAIWQSHIDASISSTVNLPNKATIDDVEKLYMLAWKNGLKGITVYRAGCAREGILVTDENAKPAKNELKRGDWKPLSDDVVYYKKKLRIGCGDLKLFIGWSEKEKEIQDIYVKKSGVGGCERLEESTAIAISAVLRLGGSIENIDKSFVGIGTCPSFATARAKGRELSSGNSCGVAIINAMKEFMKEHNGKTKVIPIKKNINSNNVKSNICPECGESMIMENGCVTCHNCGWSKCG